MKYKNNLPITLYTAGLLVNIFGMLFCMASLIFNNIIHDNHIWRVDILLIFVFAISAGETFMHLIHRIKMINIE